MKNEVEPFMTNLRCTGCWKWALSALCAGFIWVGASRNVDAQSVATADLKLAETSLALAPKDAAFYSATFNLRAAWEEFAGGALVQRLRQVPFVQKLQAEFETQWENPQGPLAEAKKRMKDPMVRALMDIALDMNSHEVFVYGESNWSDFLGSLLQFNNDMYAAAANGPEAIQAFMSELDATYIKEIHIPKTVLGFRLTNDQAVKNQLYALEGILRLVAQGPELQPFMQRLKSAEVGDTQTLSLTLDAGLIPVETVQEEFKSVLERVKEALGDRKLTLSAGVKNKILYFTIGEGAPFIQSIGQGDSLLQHDRLNALVENMPSKIRSISYASKDWRDSAWRANFEQYFSRIANQFIGAAAQELGSSDEIADWKADIQDDAQALDDQLKALAPEFDAWLSWSFSSDVGLEGLTYDWTKNDFLENAKPMNIARHAGTNPLFLLAIKHQAIPAVEEMVNLLLERAPDHIEAFVNIAENDDDDEKEKVLGWLENGWPLLEEGASIVFEEILPSIDERETLLAIAAQWTTDQLSEVDLPADVPLPLPELGLAIKVRDRNQFLAGCQALYEVFDKVVDVIREMEPDSIPANYEIPHPQQESLSGAERFFYPEFSQAFPIAGFEPQVVLSKDVVVLGYSARQVRDMTEGKPLATRPAWLEPEAAVASLSVLDWSATIESVSPWIRYGILTTVGDLDTPMAEDNGPVPTGNDILEIWNCLTALGKSATTTTIEPSGATVSRWAWVGE
jgi:hypothetical protein